MSNPSIASTLISISGVIYKDKSLYESVRKEADRKFDKNSYTKNLWVLREYKKRGGKVKYTGSKPDNESIRKQTKASFWGESHTEIDLGLQILRLELPAEITAAKQSTDPEIADLAEDLETFAQWAEEADDSFMGDFIEFASEKKKNVKLNKPFRTPGGPKKFGVYVKNDKGNVVLVRFGDPSMEIKRDDPERRKNFRARHKCDQQKDKTTPAYWSCRMWSKKPVSKITGEDESDESAAAYVAALSEIFGVAEGILD